MNPELMKYAIAIGAKRGYSLEEVRGDMATLTRVCAELNAKGISISPLDIIPAEARGATVAQQTLNLEVGGSSPPAPATAREPNPTRECGHCKMTFVYKRKDAQYCTDRCKKRAYKKRRRPGDRDLLKAARATNLAKRGNA